uniref:Predicted AAA-ATPase n=1 Tax=Candidatus Kentrum eta TaxID=2126337 RepID=A0A450UN32_9GAMM|nr:MAG: Predicted AAA-ATPase [Candidatus Kentron sp. H]VFJ94710.1 MAG: Predicted AAA-ATPase [Candidatus Kentron sp. H]VFK01333.1 MAG: Predicted AAA-ATPase [Candidatus Kentron sp. H]
MEQAGDQLLFLRPRRFGKSLWLSVLENYYDPARADRFEPKIGREGRTLPSGQVFAGADP